MKAYKKPEVEVIEIVCEGMIAVSGAASLPIDNDTPASESYEVLSKEHDFELWE